jgi:hypothetical protein
MTLREHRLRFPGETTLSSLLETWDNLLVWADHYRKYGYNQLADVNAAAADATLARVADGEGTV